MKLLADCRLYAFVDTAYLHGRAPAEVARQLCDGGADLVQLRAKNAPLDEVRRLAQRSAAAARESGAKVGASVERSEQGASISAKLADNLATIVDRTRQLDERMADIATSSHEQSQGIAQVNQAVTQLDQMTQQNAALSEESAATAATLIRQIDTLNGMVTIFRIANQAPRTKSGSNVARPRAA